MRLLLALVAGIGLLSNAANAQQFELQDVATVDATPPAQLKPKTILFFDRGSGEPSEGGDIFTRYEDWAKGKPVQAQFLSLYPGYTEPNTDIIVDGTKKRYQQKLHIYVGQARFLLDKRPSSIDLARLIALPFVQQLDPAIKHKPITASDLGRPTDMKMAYNQNPQRHWCEGTAKMICVHSSYKLEGRLPAAIALANKIRESGKKPISDTLEFDSELLLLPPDEVAQRGLPKLTGIDTPSIGALEQSIFYVNEIIEFGKMLAVFQQHPSEASKTVVTVFVSIALDSGVLVKRAQYAQVPVLRNMLPIQVLAGKSSFNFGNSLSAGLPVYARNQIKAIAGILEKS
jgi:hypothetical protein